MVERTPDAEGGARCCLHIIWDLCHYGWPDDLHIWSEEFDTRFAAFAAEAAHRIRDVSGAPPFLCPINEISYWAWAGGEVGRIGPLACGQGPALKRQLVKASLAAIRAVRAVEPKSRFIYAEHHMLVWRGHFAALLSSSWLRPPAVSVNNTA